MGDAKAKFQAMAKQSEEDKKKAEEQEQLRKAKSSNYAAGTTTIGNQKGSVKAFGAAFEARAEGHEVTLVETRGGWQKQAASTSEGKYVGGGAGGVKANIKPKEEKKGPPPKKDIKDLL